MMINVKKTVLRPPLMVQILRRERLIQKLQHQQEKRLIVLKAGPGYGKTTLAGSYYAEVEQKIWLSIPGENFGFRDFLTHLTYALHEMLQCSQSLELLNSAMQMQTEELILQLLNLLTEQVSGKLYIFIDDLQNLQFLAGEREKMIEVFFPFLPAQIQLLLICQGDLPFPLFKFGQIGDLLQIEEHLLRFTTSEIRELLLLYGMEPTVKELQQLEQLSEGWGILVLLLVQKLQEYGDAWSQALQQLQEGWPLQSFSQWMRVQKPQPLWQDTGVVDPDLQSFLLALPQMLQERLGKYESTGQTDLPCGHQQSEISRGDDIVRAYLETATQGEIVPRVKKPLVAEPTAHTSAAIPRTKPILRFQLFGGFTIRSGTRLVTQEDWTNKKASHLLKFLILNRSRLVLHDHILELFWPDLEVVRARQNMYVAINVIRKTLEPELKNPKESHYIISQHGYCKFNTQYPYWLDLEDFENSYAEGIRYYQKKLYRKMEEYFLRARKLYQQGFMVENLADDWCVEERKHFSKLYVEMTEILFNRFRESDVVRALKLGLELFELEPHLEATNLALLQLLLQMGERQKAVEMCQRMKVAYEHELKVEVPFAIREWQKQNHIY